MYNYELGIIKDKIKDVEGFPIEGVTFKDMSPLLADNRAFRDACYIMAIQNKVPDYYVAMDARGFLFAAPMTRTSSSYDKAGLLLCRKKGKLPGKCVEQEYTLEYGKNVLELRADIAEPGSEVVIIDDILATGGTALAACKLCEKVGLKVLGVTVLMEIEGLNGREVLEKAGYRVNSVLRY